MSGINEISRILSHSKSKQRIFPTLLQFKTGLYYSFIIIIIIFMIFIIISSITLLLLCLLFTAGLTIRIFLCQFSRFIVQVNSNGTSKWSFSEMKADRYSSLSQLHAIQPDGDKNEVKRNTFSQWNGNLSRKTWDR